MQGAYLEFNIFLKDTTLQLADNLLQCLSNGPP